MTQAGLSPELSPSPTFGALEGRADASASVGAAASLWLLALTSATLVFVALLLLGLLAQGTGGDGYVGGFATAVATLTGGLGLVAAGYVLLTAHRAGYLRATSAERDSIEPAAPSGLRVAPAVPAGLAYRKRQQLAAGRARRRAQARAIDAAGLAKPGPLAPMRTPAASAPVQTARAQAPAPPRVAPRRPATPPVRVQARTRPMPRPVVRPAASALPPTILRLNPPTVRPRGQAALLQVGIASVRAPFVPRQPHPVLRRSVSQP